MLIKTRYFGEIDVDDQKIITFDNGLIGFEYLKKFTLIYNNESEKPVYELMYMDKRLLSSPHIAVELINKDVFRR